MPSYNREKLERLIEARRAALLRRRDVYERANDAREESNRRRERIRYAAQQVATPTEFVERLLALRDDEAMALPDDEIDTYRRPYQGGAERGFNSGIAVESYRRYIAARREVDRLAALLADAQADVEQHRIVPNLVEAVKQWGFRDIPKIGIL